MGSTIAVGRRRHRIAVPHMLPSTSLSDSAPMMYCMSHPTQSLSASRGRRRRRTHATLTAGCLGIGEVGRAENADENLRLMDFARRRIDDPDPLARVVDEHLLPGNMVLPHHQRQPSLESAKQVAEPTISVALLVDRPVFLPE